MKIQPSPLLGFISRLAVAAGLSAVLLAAPAMSRAAAQDATPPTGFIETVGGATTRELPAPIYYDADGDGSLSADELATAVEERYPKMIWPEAYAVPLEDLLAAVEASDQASWPIGSEFRVLEMPAVCAWFEAYLDAFDRGDTLQQPAALDQAMYVLGGVRSMTADESLGALDAIRYATLGDAARIQAYVDEGPCQDATWFDADATPQASPVSRVSGLAR